jgi:hypothetical protein
MPRARAHLALKDLRSAQDCVRNVLATASLQTGRFTLVEALLCGARIAQLSEDPGRTLEMLIWAIEIAPGRDHPALHPGAGELDHQTGRGLAGSLCTAMWITCAKQRRACVRHGKCWGLCSRPSRLTGPSPGSLRSAPCA